MHRWPLLSYSYTSSWRLPFPSVFAADVIVTVRLCSHRSWHWADGAVHSSVLDDFWVSSSCLLWLVLPEFGAHLSALSVSYDQFSLCRWVSKLKFLLTYLLIDFSCRYLSLLLSSQQFPTFVSACLSLEYGGAGEKEGKAAPRELCLSDKGGQRQPKARLCLVCDSPGSLLLAAAWSEKKALGWFWNMSHW